MSYLYYHLLSGLPKLAANGLRLVLFSFLFISANNISAQNYLLDFNDPTTYSITCGRVIPAHWTVNSEDCTIYTSEIQVAGDSLINPPATMDLFVRIEGSSLDAGDSATISYSVDGVWFVHSVMHGRAGIFTEIHTWQILVPAGALIQVSVNFYNQHWTDRWRLYNGDIRVNSVGGVLPVELMSFGADVKNASVVLNWKTASEVNNNYFTIERSMDGITFAPVGTVNGNGTSSSVHEYAFTDFNPLKGVSYYKLTQTDFDGKTSSPGGVLHIVVPYLNTVMEVFPNPNQGKNLYVNLSGITSDNITLTIHDLSGKEVYKRKFITERNGSIPNRKLSGIKKLSSGVYILKAKSDEQLFTTKFIVN